MGSLNTLVRFNPFIPAGIVLLGAAMGVWVALSAHGWAALRNRYGFWLGGVLASSRWAGSEWLRTLGPYGFPWGLFGVSQQPAVPLIQLTAFTGVYGLTFLLVLCNGFLADAMMAWLTEREMRRARGKASPAMVEKVRASRRRALIASAGVGVIVVVIAIGGWIRVKKRKRSNCVSDTMQTCL